MADIDPTLPGQVFNSMDYGHIIAGPIVAASDAQKQMSYITAAFVKSVGFDENGKMITSIFSHTKTHTDGKREVETFEVPFLSLIPLPNIQISEGNVTLDVEVNQSAETKSKAEGGGEGSFKAGWGPFGISIKARASYSRENTRKTDTRAKQHVEVHFKQAEMPEGISLMIEHLRNSAFDAIGIGAIDQPAIPAPAKVGK